MAGQKQFVKLRLRLGHWLKDCQYPWELVWVKFALVVGNEGNGVRREITDKCDKNLYIRMNTDVESLNVGVATSILLYELDR